MLFPSPSPSSLDPNRPFWTSTLWDGACHRVKTAHGQADQECEARWFGLGVWVWSLAVAGSSKKKDGNPIKKHGQDPWNHSEKMKDLRYRWISVVRVKLWNHQQWISFPREFARKAMGRGPWIAPSLIPDLHRRRKELVHGPPQQNWCNTCGWDQRKHGELKSSGHGLGCLHIDINLTWYIDLKKGDMNIFSPTRWFLVYIWYSSPVDLHGIPVAPEVGRPISEIWTDKSSTTHGVSANLPKCSPQQFWGLLVAS